MITFLLSLSLVLFGVFSRLHAGVLLSHHDEDAFEPRHPWDYDEYTPTSNLLEFPRPSEDKLEKGIPEGVVKPGGDISGFLYFSKHDWGRVTFTMNLVDAKTGKAFGTIGIPFVMRSGCCPRRKKM
jgi:hypothetical protein